MHRIDTFSFRRDQTYRRHDATAMGRLFAAVIAVVLVVLGGAPVGAWESTFAFEDYRATITIARDGSATLRYSGNLRIHAKDETERDTRAEEVRRQPGMIALTHLKDNLFAVEFERTAGPETHVWFAPGGAKLFGPGIGRLALTDDVVGVFGDRVEPSSSLRVRLAAGLEVLDDNATKRINFLGLWRIYEWTAPPESDGDRESVAPVMRIRVPASAEVERALKAESRGDGARAFRLLTPAADRGEPAGLYHLGRLTRDGIGVAPDADRAVALFQAAAERGHARAMLALGRMHEDGFAAHAADPAHAAAWYEKAGRRRLWEAQAALAELYAEGRGVPRDPWQACFWYMLASFFVGASDPGEKDAMAARAEEACASKPTREGIAGDLLEADECAGLSFAIWFDLEFTEIIFARNDEEDGEKHFKYLQNHCNILQ